MSMNLHPLFAAIVNAHFPDPCHPCEDAEVCGLTGCAKADPEDDPGYGDPQDLRLEAYPEDWARDLALTDTIEAGK